MLSTSGNRQFRKSEKSVTGDPAIDSAFLRLSHVLKEIAESAVDDKEEATGVKSYTKAPQVRSSNKKEGRYRDAIVEASAWGPQESRGESRGNHHTA